MRVIFHVAVAVQRFIRTACIQLVSSTLVLRESRESAQINHARECGGS